MRPSGPAKGVRAWFLLSILTLALAKFVVGAPAHTTIAPTPTGDAAVADPNGVRLVFQVEPGPNATRGPEQASSLVSILARRAAAAGAHDVRAQRDRRTKHK
jgi:hypothetical protein